MARLQKICSAYCSALQSCSFSWQDMQGPTSTWGLEIGSRLAGTVCTLGKKIKISFGGIPNSRNVLFLQIFLKRAAKPSTGTFSGTLLNLTWLCTKASQTFSATFSGTLLNQTWLCTKASQTFTGTFSGTLLNLTWLCTKASPTFSGNFSGPLLNLTWPGSAPRPSPETSPEPSPDLLRNPVEPDLALHQGFLEPSPESPKPCWTWPGTAPKPSRPSSEPSRKPCWTWPGSVPKPPRPSPEPSEPSLELCWTWPGACTSAHRSFSGLKTPLAYAVGEKSYSIDLRKVFYKFFQVQCLPELRLPMP